MGKFGKNMVVRTLSGAVLFIVVVAAVLLSEYSFAALLLVIALGSMWEFFRMARARQVRPQGGFAMALGGLTVLMAFFAARGDVPASLLGILLPAVALMFFVELFRKSENPLLNISVSIGGLFYAAIPMALLCFVAYAGGSYEGPLVLGYIFIVWVNDIFAYLSGVALGRHRLSERISPNKSWEGFFGGLVFAIGFAVLCGYLRGESMIWWGGLGAVVVITGVLGDLVESMFKRSVNIKDSGSIIPGHGGFIDRFDALLLSAPFVYLYFIIFAC